LVFQIPPNKLGAFVGMPSKALEAVIYYEKFVVIQTVLAKNWG
jgi:hypothetical protein